MPRLLLIGDVGGPATHHVGDEAMLSANLAHLRERWGGSRRRGGRRARSIFLSPKEAPEVELPHEPWIAVTLTGPAERLVDVYGPALAALHRRIGCPLVFVPHAAAPDDDARLGKALARRLGPLLTPLPLLEERQAAWVTQRASMVVSSRYHPLVLAAPRGEAGAAKANGAASSTPGARLDDPAAGGRDEPLDGEADGPS